MWLPRSQEAFFILGGNFYETPKGLADLLFPGHRGDNGYFYYDVEQFYDFYAISVFRQTGTPLEEIRRCLQEQDAVQTLALLREQRGRLEAERQKLEHMDFVLSSALHNLEFGPVPDMAPQTAWFEEGLTGPGTISHLYTRIKEKADFPYYMEKPAGIFLRGIPPLKTIFRNRAWRLQKISTPVTWLGSSFLV